MFCLWGLPDRWHLCNGGRRLPRVAIEKKMKGGGVEHKVVDTQKKVSISFCDLKEKNVESKGKLSMLL